MDLEVADEVRSQSPDPTERRASCARNRRRWGGYIVHVGIAVLFLGVAASSAFHSQRDLRMKQGQTTTVGGYTVKYLRPTADVGRDTAGTGAPDSYFNAEYTENGPGTSNEPLGMPGWTGADSTYSVLLPSGDTAFFFSDSYIGEFPAVSGDGTVSTDANGLRTRFRANIHGRFRTRLRLRVSRSG